MPELNSGNCTWLNRKLRHLHQAVCCAAQVTSNCFQGNNLTDAAVA